MESNITDLGFAEDNVIDMLISDLSEIAMEEDPLFYETGVSLADMPAFLNAGEMKASEGTLKEKLINSCKKKVASVKTDKVMNKGNALEACDYMIGKMLSDDAKADKFLASHKGSTTDPKKLNAGIDDMRKQLLTQPGLMSILDMGLPAGKFYGVCMNAISHDVVEKQHKAPKAKTAVKENAKKVGGNAL